MLTASSQCHRAEVCGGRDNEYPMRGKRATTALLLILAWQWEDDDADEDENDD
jgi:hypothetical protein